MLKVKWLERYVFGSKISKDSIQDIPNQLGVHMPEGKEH
jgi:hypothetical protein